MVLISSFAAILSGVAVMLMLIHICADVALKYLGLQPIPATLEITASYYMPAITFLPLVCVQMRRHHLAVEIVVERLAPAKRHLAGIGAALATALYCTCVAAAGLSQAIEQTSLGEVTFVGYFDLEVWPSRWFVPFGFAAMAAAATIQCVKQIRTRGAASRDGTAQADAVD